MPRIITKIEAPTPIAPALIPTAAYARVSGGKDAQLHSLSAQVSYYSDYIQRRADWEYKGVFTDEAYTGTKNTRKGLQALLDECRAGNIRQIITKSISRFARNTVDLLNIAHEMRAIGVGIYFEEQLIDTMSGDGELMLTILASYAQEESRSASENQKWRIRKCYQEGKSTNHIDVYGYEYKNGLLTVIPEEAEVVRMIFSDYLGGMGKNAIMRKLERLYVPTKNGGRWTENTVASILKNEKHIGDTCLQKGFIADHITKRHKPNRGELPKYYVEGTHEAIIDKETFDAAQAEIARRAVKVRTPKRETQSEFAGIIKCGRCGASAARSAQTARSTPRRYGYAGRSSIAARASAQQSAYPKTSSRRNALR